MKNYLREYLDNRPLFISIIRHREAELFEEYASYEHPVLDFGCGDGFFTSLIVPELEKIDTGLDMDTSDLEQAYTRGVYKKIVNYDGRDIPFDDGFFFTAISNCVLEHVADIEYSIKELSRVIRPNGKLFTTVMTNKWEEYLFGNKLGGKKYQKWMKRIQVHHNLLSDEQWRNLFGKYGFKIEKEVGYMDERSSKWMDILHYLSIDSLITKKLLGRWVILPQRYRLFPIESWIRGLEKDVQPQKSAAIFYALRRTS